MSEKIPSRDAVEIESSAQPIVRPISIRRGRYALLIVAWFVVAWPLLYHVDPPEGFRYLYVLAVIFPAMLLTAARLRNMGCGWAWALLVFAFPVTFILPILCMFAPEGAGKHKDRKLQGCLALLTLPALLITFMIALYPSSLLQGELASVTITTQDLSSNATVTITSAEDLKEFQSSLRRVWKPFFCPWSENEGPFHFSLKIIYRDGKIENLAGNDVEFIGGARVSKEFRAEIEKLCSEHPHDTSADFR